MVRSFRLSALLVSAFGVSALLCGCHSANKTPAAAGLTPQTPAAVQSTTSSPGTSDLFVGNKLKNPVKVHLAYALWHEQEGNLIEARNSYEKVLKESPKNIDATLGLARLDIAQSRMDDAERRLSNAQKLAPKNHQVAISLGQYYSARGEWPRALEQMKLARSLSPYDQASAYHLGYVQAKTGDMTSALASFTEAVGAAEAQYNLAHILYEQGNLISAEEYLQRAISMKPDLAQAQSLLLTVRQQREGSKMPLVSGRGVQGLPAASQGIQPASYTVPPKTSCFDPAPAQ